MNDAAGPTIPVRTGETTRPVLPLDESLCLRSELKEAMKRREGEGGGERERERQRWRE